MGCRMTAKSPNDWPGFLARLQSGSKVTLVGPLHSGPFEPAGPTVFVDGGTRFRRKDLEKFPCISVGDGDSGQAELDVRLPAEKDFSDLAFVLRELPQTVLDLRLVGFSGGRLDHMLANLGEIHRFLKSRGPAAQAAVDRMIVGSGGNLELKILGGFSVMVLESADITISGDCRYPLHEGTLEPASSHGLSNVGHGMVRISAGGPFFVLLSDKGQPQ